MEPQHQHQYQYDHTTTNNSINNINSMSGGGMSKSSYLCRQSSTRWIPTPDQIRILRDLYYNAGVRSPSAEQIQKISARLRQYGKIEGKNVFYWFQNHKARERQKRRLTVDVLSPNPIINNIDNSDNNKFTNSNTVNHLMSPLPGSGPVAPLLPPCPGLYHDAGQMGSSTVLTDASFREFCLPEGAVGDGPELENNTNINTGWINQLAAEPSPAAATTAMPWISCQYYATEQGAAAAASREIETLPLFPIHSQQQQHLQELGEWEDKVHNSEMMTNIPSCWVDKACQLPPAFYWGCGGGDGAFGGQQQPQEQQEEQEDFKPHYYHHHSGGSGGAASLELTLNSYCYAHPESLQ